jgi:hypothetical protein
MLKRSLILALFISRILLHAQTGQIFPALNGVTLDDKTVHVPLLNSKYSVIAIAFHRDAEADLKKWLEPLYDSFIKKENTKGMDMADFMDVNFVFIPMINGFKRVADEFKKGTDKHYWPYIMDTEKTDIKGLQERLGVTDSKIPYFFVLDASGKVVASESGRFDEAKISRLEEAVE